MRSFTYVKPVSIEAAAREGANEGSVFIAGGTNVLDLMKLEIETPSRLVDINGLALRGIEASDDGSGVLIGALASNTDVAAHAVIRRRYPVLARALLAGASAQIRNQATMAGNLLQRTRCSYFYDGASACNKRSPGAGCSAVEGYNRGHAILGASERCIASHPSDMAVALRALGALLRTQRADGVVRRFDLADLYRLPDAAPRRETTLEPGELITHIELPPPPRGEQIYRKVRDRASFAFALVAVAAVVEVENGRISSASLAFGGIAPVPWRKREVEAALVHQPATTATFASAADALLADARGWGANDFKIALVRRTLISCLRDIAGRGE